jgi:predicted ATP-grasp superfamily ATP-dependent carboligase
VNGHLRFDRLPALVDPALVCAFQGWNDGGEAASVAARYLMERWNAEPFGRIDAEEFYDFQVNRPSVRLEDGVSRVIDWPNPGFAAASPPGRDVVFLTAADPSVRWQAFTAAVLDACGELRVSLLVTLGGFLTDVPHGRPVPVVGSARSPEEAERLGLAQSRYEGPTGIVGVIHDAANRAGIASVSLWTAVPHYLPVTPNPKAALALVERACAVLGTVVDTDALNLAVGRWERGVARLLAENDELNEYASRLEAGADDAEEDEESEMGDEAGGQGDESLRDLGSVSLPSRDELADEVERFLRERAHGEPGDEA